jgi:hypothetical protein
MHAPLMALCNVFVLIFSIALAAIIARRFPFTLITGALGAFMVFWGKRNPGNRLSQFFQHV